MASSASIACPDPDERARLHRELADRRLDLERALDSVHRSAPARE
jgi:hypothetical protein